MPTLPPEAEVLLTDWFRRVRESQRIHYECGTYFGRFNLLLGLPTIALTAAVGAAVFISFEKSATGNARIFVGLLSLIATVLASLQTFLKFSERAERHRLTGAGYGSLRRAIELLKTFPPDNTEALRKQIDELKKQMDALAKEAPEVPSHIKTRLDKDMKSREHKRIFHLQGQDAPNPD